MADVLGTSASTDLYLRLLVCVCLAMQGSGRWVSIYGPGGNIRVFVDKLRFNLTQFLEITHVSTL